jgi:REP element-mobilizing transposase RayT
MSRVPPRLPRFSYVGIHAYFVTVCTHQRRPVFLEPSAAQDAIDQFLRTALHHQFAAIAYCVMPDHAHVVVEAESDDSNLELLVHGWKTRTGFSWKRHSHQPLWQRGYHERVLREGEPMLGVARYTILNPVRAGLVVSVDEYPYVGSSRYTVAEILAAASEWKPMWE